MRYTIEPKSISAAEQIMRKADVKTFIGSVYYDNGDVANKLFATHEDATKWALELIEKTSKTPRTFTYSVTKDDTGMYPGKYTAHILEDGIRKESIHGFDTDAEADLNGSEIVNGCNRRARLTVQ